MTMASFLRGKPIMQDYTPASPYNAGDVIVVNNLPCVAHEANPYDGSTTNLVKDALAVSGGIYQITSDSAYSPGTSVFWDTVLQKVTTIQGANAYHFGWVVGGANDVLNDSSGTTVSVLHDPQGRQQAVSSSLLANFRNLIDGGDFTTNPWQRGTAQLADIANTITYGPDRFFLKSGGAGGAVDFSKVADTSIAGFGSSLKFQRKSANADVNVITLGQMVETNDSIRTQGQQVTLSFWAKCGANFSAAGNTVTVQVESGTGSDQAASTLIGGTMTGQSHVINVTQALTTVMTRYQWTGTVPAGCTQLGFLLQFTPVGTAGADDSITINGIQLEIGNGATPFEHRDVQVELEICQRYFYQINEPASGVVVGAGMVSATNTEVFYVALPVQMRTAPTVTVTVGSFKSNSATAGVVAATGLTGNATHTVNTIGLTSTGTGTAGQGALLQGGGGAGVVAVSADY
jgi:hypothetical protein